MAFIVLISYPFNLLRIAMIAVLAIFSVLCFVVPFLRTVFGISGNFVLDMLTLTAPVTVGGIGLLIGFTVLFRKIKFPQKLPPTLQKFADKL